MISSQGLIFDIQRYSVHDGPGIRTLVFLKGCPLRCRWCSNPESQKATPELGFRRALCIGCGVCVDVCSRQAIQLKDTSVEVDRSQCDLCGECVKVCSPEALSIVGRWVTVEQVLAEVERDLIFYELSQGGITISGGEPLAQAHFVEALLKTCKARGMTTAIETAGYAPWSSIERVIRYADLVLYDLKHIDPVVHRQLIGVSNRPILENARRIANLEVPLTMRCPVVPGFNDAPHDMDVLFRFVANLPGVKQVDLIPYHRLGKPKYAMLGRDYVLKEVRPPARQNLERLTQVANRRGLEVNIVA